MIQKIHEWDRFQRALRLYVEWSQKVPRGDPALFLERYPDLHDLLADLLEADGEPPRSPADNRSLPPTPVNESVGGQRRDHSRRQVPEQRAGRRLQWRAHGPSPGASVGPYLLLEEIGTGGSGIVYRAREQSEVADREVAVKVLSRQFADPLAVERFRREARSLSGLNHPNIATFLSADVTDAGAPYLAMELVAGGVPITDYCRDHRLTLAERVELMLSVCQAIHHAHQRGLVHRDLKPANLLVRDDAGVARPKVIDFGLGLQLNDEQPGGDSNSRITRSWQILGTPDYMSPEQLRGDTVDTRSDQFSVGVLLFEILSGTLPRQVPAEHQLNVQRLSVALLSTGVDSLSRELDPARRVALATERRTYPAGLRRVLKSDLSKIVEKMLQLDPEQRFDSMSDVARDLQRYLRLEPVSAQSPGILYTTTRLVQRHPGTSLATALFVLAVITFPIWISWLYLQLEATNENLSWNAYRSGIRNASYQLDRGERTAANATLDSTPTRGSFEWNLLHHQATGAIAELQRDHAWVLDLQFTDDGKLVPVTPYDLMVFDPLSGTRERELVLPRVRRGGRRKYKVLAVDSGLQRIVVQVPRPDDSNFDLQLLGLEPLPASSTRSTRVLNTSLIGTGAGLRAKFNSAGDAVHWWFLPGHDLDSPRSEPGVASIEQEPGNLAMRADPGGILVNSDVGTLVATDGELVRITGQSGSEVRDRLCTFAGQVRGLEVSGRLAAVATESSVTVVDGLTAREMFRLDCDHPVCAIEARTGLLAVGDSSGRLRVFELASGRTVLDCQAHEGPVELLALDSSRPIVATYLQSEAIRTWYAGSPEQVLSARFLRGFAVDAMGHRLAIASPRSRDHRLYDPISGNGLGLLLPAVGTASVTFAPDGTGMALGGTDGSLWFASLAGDSAPQVLSGARPGLDVASVDIHPAGRWLLSTEATDAGDLSAQLWDLHRRVLVRQLDLPISARCFARFSTGGKYVVLAMEDQAWLYDPMLNTLEHEFKTQRSVAALDPGERYLATSTGKGVRIVDLVDGRVLRTSGELLTTITAMSWSRDGTRLAIGGGQAIVVVDSAHLEPLLQMTVERPVQDLEFHGEFDWLLARTENRQGEGRIWRWDGSGTPLDLMEQERRRGNLERARAIAPTPSPADAETPWVQKVTTHLRRLKASRSQKIGGD